jgi:hypothetical protein
MQQAGLMIVVDVPAVACEEAEIFKPPDRLANSETGERKSRVLVH